MAHRRAAFLCILLLTHAGVPLSMADTPEGEVASTVNVAETIAQESAKDGGSTPTEVTDEPEEQRKPTTRLEETPEETVNPVEETAKHEETRQTTDTTEVTTVKDEPADVVEVTPKQEEISQPEDVFKATTEKTNEEADRERPSGTKFIVAPVETTTSANVWPELTTVEEDEDFGLFSLFSMDSEEAAPKPATTTEAAPTTEQTQATVASGPPTNMKLSDQIRAILTNYREYGSVTLPGNHLPDPLSVPDMQHNLAGTPITFTNTKVYGLSNFTVDHVNTDLEKMQVYVALKMERLEILGNYTLKSWMKRASGPFNVTLYEVEASGSAELSRDEEGNLQATDSVMDMSFMDTRVDFKNLGIMGSILQGVLASAGPFLFDAIKPAILDEVNMKIRTDVNDKIRTIGDKISMAGDDKPLDRAVMEGRKYVRDNGYDPYLLEDYVIQRGMIEINISEFWLGGLSRFYRVGDVSLSMDAGVLQLGMHLATKTLYGKCKWKISLGTVKREGRTSVTIDHIQIRAFVNQSLDVKLHPVLHDLDIYVGKPVVQMERTDHLDILLEIAFNSLPDLLRHIIVDALEEPIKYKVQKILDDVDMEAIMEQNLPELDNMGL